MSRIRKTLGIAVVAVPVAVLGAGSLAAASDAAATTTMRVTIKPVQSTHLDLGKKGLSQGDQMVFAEDLLIRGKKAGSDGGVCTVTRATAGSHEMQCVGTARLPKGQLTFQGLGAEAGRTSLLAITGGTGAYRDAGGYVSVRHAPDGTASVTVLLDHVKR